LPLLRANATKSCRQGSPSRVVPGPEQGWIAGAGQQRKFISVLERLAAVSYCKVTG